MRYVFMWANSPNKKKVDKGKTGGEGRKRIELVSIGGIESMVPSARTGGRVLR